MNGRKHYSKHRHLLTVATFLCALMLASTASAQIKWHTISEASKTAIGQKIYLIDFYTTWCGYCKKMDRQTFTDPVVSAIVNNYYYPVKFNAENETSFSWNGVKYQMSSGGNRAIHQFAQAVLGRQMGFPSFAILRADGSLIQVIPGYYPPADFARSLWFFASGDYERYSYDEYVKIFDDKIRQDMKKQLQMN